MKEKLNVMPEPIFLFSSTYLTRGGFNGSPCLIWSEQLLLFPDWISFLSACPSCSSRRPESRSNRKNAGHRKTGKLGENLDGIWKTCTVFNNLPGTLQKALKHYFLHI
jgi:hypothetical protein